MTPPEEGPDQEAAFARPIATVGAAIFDPAGNVLMVRTRKWSNLWGIPGGKIRRNESSQAALQREIREETNLDVADVRFVLAQDCIQSPEFYRDAHFILLNYTCRAREPLDVQLNDEAQEFRWMTLKEALAMPLNQPTRILLETAAAGQNPAATPSEPAKDRIVIEDLEVSFRVGVPDAERASAQRLLITVELETGFSAAAAGDDLSRTIDYFAVSRRLLAFGENQSWKLIEKLAVDIAETVIREFGPSAVTVTVKKFILPETRCVAVTTRRP